MLKAYSAAEYTNVTMGERGSFGRAIWDSINMCAYTSDQSLTLSNRSSIYLLVDILKEIWVSTKWFFGARKAQRQGGANTAGSDGPTFDEAFLPSYAHAMSQYDTRPLTTAGVSSPSGDRSTNTSPIPPHPTA